MPSNFVNVAVPVPTLGLLTYRVPDDVAEPAVGARVIVPLGARTVTGIVVSRVDAAAGVADGDLKAIRQVLDADAFIPPDVVSLAHWTAEYYAAGPGEAITAVLPPKTRGARADAHKTRRIASITASGMGAREAATADANGDGQHRGLTARQQEVLDLLAAAPLGLPTPDLTARGISSDTIGRLAAHGLVVVRAERVDRDPFEMGSDLRGQIRVGSGSDQGPIGVRSGSDQGPIRVRSGSDRDRIRVRSGSDQDPIRVRSGSDQRRTPVRPHAS